MNTFDNGETTLSRTNTVNHVKIELGKISESVINLNNLTNDNINHILAKLDSMSPQDLKHLQHQNNKYARAYRYLNNNPAFKMTKKLNNITRQLSNKIQVINPISRNYAKWMQNLRQTSPNLHNQIHTIFNKLNKLPNSRINQFIYDNLQKIPTSICNKAYADTIKSISRRNYKKQVVNKSGSDNKDQTKVTKNDTEVHENITVKPTTQVSHQHNYLLDGESIFVVCIFIAKIIKYLAEHNRKDVINNIESWLN